MAFSALGLIVSFAALAGYYTLWARYLVTGRAVRSLYRPLGKFPVPMAILPVIVFLATAGWLNNAWMAGAALIPAAGIVARAQNHSRRVPEEKFHD